MLWCRLLFVYFQLWNGLQYAIPKVQQVVFPNVSVQCGIFHSDVNGLLYCSCHIVVFPAYYFKIFHRCYVASVTVLLCYWCSCFGDGVFRCSLYLSSKVLADSPIYSSSQSILSHLNQYITSTFLLDVVFVFR